MNEISMVISKSWCPVHNDNFYGTSIKMEIITGRLSSNPHHQRIYRPMRISKHRAYSSSSYKDKDATGSIYEAPKVSGSRGLLGFLGIFGLALPKAWGFASKRDALSPLYAKLPQQMFDRWSWKQKMFNVNDDIKVGDLEGKVTDVYSDMLVLTGKDNSLLSVDNKFLEGKMIENLTHTKGVILKETFRIEADRAARVTQMTDEIEDALRQIQSLALELLEPVCTMDWVGADTYDVTYKCCLHKLPHDDLNDIKCIMIDAVRDTVKKYNFKILKVNHMKS